MSPSIDQSMENGSRNEGGSAKSGEIKTGTATLTMPDGRIIELPCVSDVAGGLFVDIRTLQGKTGICTLDPGMKQPQLVQILPPLCPILHIICIMYTFMSMGRLREMHRPEMPAKCIPQLYIYLIFFSSAANFPSKHRPYFNRLLCLQNYVHRR